jgi:two-component system, LytTR family, response regulator LytT
MRIIILEDELLIAEHLKEIVESFGHKVLEIAKNKTEFFNAVKHATPDIAILDINIEGKCQGIEVAEEIKRNYHFLHIFITSFSDTKLIDAAIKSNPVNYLIKPFNEGEIYAALKSAEDKVKRSKNDSFVLVRSGNKKIKISAVEILYVKSDNIYLELTTSKGFFLERSSLSNFIDSLKFEDLMRVHRSYAVNIRFVNALKPGSLILNKEQIPVSRKYYERVKERCQKLP